MDKRSLRWTMIYNPNAIRAISLTDTQIALVKRIRCAHSEGVTSRLIADEYDVSIQCSSGRLVKLLKKGYLSRKNVGCDSGGDEYIYYYVEKSTCIIG
ncbi:MAG: hypothetical protein OEM38_09320 [Gammaproteobacteria bacterium]|nr:hypothetical protein [Gammaproteobacteria bacterium]